MSKSHVVVVGAGVFGSWTATHLLRKGHRVTLVDAWGPAHARSSSGGESRMTRGAYGGDTIYTRMALDSLPEWKALSAVSGLPIFHECGVLFFFAKEEPYLTDSLAAHRQIGIPLQTLDHGEMARKFPMIDFTGIGIGMCEPGFGALMARRAVGQLVDIFVQRGGRFRRGAVQPPAPGRDLTEITLSSGERLKADHFVFAAGPWLPKLFPDVVGPRILPTRQEVFFFAPPAGDSRFLPASMPGWADFNGGDMYYGFPDLENRGVKFAHDLHGPEVDPDTQDRRPSPAALAEIVAYRDRRFPALRGAPLTEARVCQYENSSNGDFLIDRHPQWPNVLLVGGGSGHGFKHGPEVGRYAAGRLFDSMNPEPRFSFASKSETHHREVH
ncbi:FAD-dependent oxidoreductase [Sphingomonas flavescens]|uniref:FAD-dependent oxidoreductase n=1 Tax=Sphingomonas flavescens TaxID=3132797 RepID=UPI002804970F|nr:FAD-dependent oxidoreductase [Sphingomonas limnosediminicola]